MLHSLRVIALAVLLSRSPMRLRRIFVKLGSLVVIAIRHMTFLKFNSQRATIRHSRSRSGKSRNGAMSICRNFHHAIGICDGRPIASAKPTRPCLGRVSRPRNWPTRRSQRAAVQHLIRGFAAFPGSMSGVPIPRYPKRSLFIVRLRNLCEPT
jgi:hypothetical protein